MRINEFVKKHENIIIILGCVLTFLLCALFVFKRNMILMTADEMGPIAVAAYWNGYDWSDVMSHGAYYSYGYSIILFPLFFLFKTPELFYKSVIVVNAVFSALMTLLSWKISREMRPDINPTIRLAISFFCGSSMVNISRSPSAWDEVFIAFLCWFILFAIVKTVKTGKASYYILCAVLSVFLYVTHQRTIGVFVVIQSFVFFISLFDSKRLKKFIPYVFTVIGLMVGHCFIKADVKEKVWLNSIQSETNDYSLYLTAHLGEKYYLFLIFGASIVILGVVAIILVSIFLKKRDSSNLKTTNWFRRILLCGFIFTCFLAFVVLNGSKLFLSLYTISAQLLYIGTCSLSLAFIGIIFTTLRLIDWIKEGAGIERNTNDAIYAFVLISFLALFSVSIISTHSGADPMNTGRADYMFYGRYVEPIIGIIAFAGGLNLDNVWNKRYYYSFATLLMVIFTFLAVARYELFRDLPFSFHNCVAFNVFSKGEDINFIAAEVVLSVFLILFIWVSHEFVRNLLLFGGVGLALANGIIYLNERVVPLEEAKYVYKALFDKMETIDQSVPLYYMGEEQTYIYNSSYVQYLMPGHKPLLYGDLNRMPEGDYYIVTESRDYLFKHSNLNMIDKKGELYLVTNMDFNGNLGVEIAMDSFWFPSETEAIDDSVVEDTDSDSLNLENDERLKVHSSNYMEGIYMYGPYIALQKGNYEVTFFYSAESIDPKGAKGRFDLVGVYGRKIYATVDIVDVMNGRITIPITLKEGSPQNEFRIYAVANQNVTINKVMIKKLEE